MSHPNLHPVRASKTLTCQERIVLNLVAEGLTNQQIADKLFVSRRTADFHLVNIYRKLDVHSRLQAIMVARRMGLLKIRDK